MLEFLKKLTVFYVLRLIYLQNSGDGTYILDLNVYLLLLWFAVTAIIMYLGARLKMGCKMLSEQLITTDIKTEVQHESCDQGARNSEWIFVFIITNKHKLISMSKATTMHHSV